MINLYDHQKENVKEARDMIVSGKKAILFQAPTGYGKTVTMAAMVQSALDKGNDVAIILPRKELIRQTALTLDSFNINYSYLAASKPYNPFSKVLICSLQSLKSRTDKIKQNIKVVFVDETHFATTMLKDGIEYFKNKGAIIIGFSATPWRSDGTGLKCFYDDMVRAPQVVDLIEMGFLSEYKLFAPSTIDTSGLKITAGDFNKKDLSTLMDSNRQVVGDAVKYYKQKAGGKRAVCYCVSVKHAETTAQIFRENGVPAAAIHGGMNDKERLFLIRSFADGGLMVLMNCDLLTFGFDLAAQVGRDVTIEALIDLRPTKSLSLQMQKWGRALRKKDMPAIILDHAGNATEHGLPCDMREWTLESRKRKKKSSGTTINQCKECHFIFNKSLNSCPECGSVVETAAGGGGGEREVEEVEGELKEIDVKEKRRLALEEQGRATSLDALIALGKNRGYKRPEQWAAHVLSARMIKEQRGING
jgi:superfamily II DNA or RNA helicase